VLSVRIASAAASSDHSWGMFGSGWLRSGTETIVPWLVSAEAVATRVSE
jgi:hypothetical protein